MSWDLQTRINLLRLRAKVKGLAEEIRRGRNHLKKFPHDDEGGWLTKKYCVKSATLKIGIEARNYLLAYGFLRGIPYSAMESKSSTKPNAEAILKIIHDHLPKYEIQNWTLEMIQTMLDVESEQAADTFASSDGGDSKGSNY